MRHENYSRGFTLIELLVVIGIVAILASIAFPAYSTFTKQANRTDVTKAMQLAAQSLERCYSRSYKYGACTVNGVVINNGSTMVTPNGFYRVTFAIPTNQDYTLTAVAIAAPQTGDNQCATYTLSSTGQQTALNSGGVNNTRACWGSN